MAGDAGVAEPVPPDPGTKPDGGYEVCQPVCTPHEYRYCDSAPCTSNADCPDNMVCHTETWQECSGGGGACKPGYDCNEADADGSYADASYSCTDHSRSRCTLRANLPCQTGSDCGDGYDCIRGTSTTCWGGGKVDADGSVTIEDSGCTTEPSDYSYCTLQPLPCELDSECPAGMTCRDQYSYECDAGGGVRPGGSGAVDGGVVDGGPAPAPCAPVIARMCQPWYPGTPDAGAGSDIGGLGGGTGGTGPVYDAGTPTNGGVGGGGIAGGGPGGSGGAVGGGNPGQTSDAGASADAGTGAPDDEHKPHRGGFLRRVLHAIFDSGGCSTSGAPAHGNFGWLSLLSLGLVRRRRKR